MAEMGIYTITHIPSGRQYVGSTVYVRRRFAQHRWGLMRNKNHSPHLQDDWNRDGPRMFIFALVEAVRQPDGLYPAEQRWVDQLRPFYNRCRPALRRHARARTPASRSAARDRFWSYVDTSGGLDACWFWLKGRDRKGYGRAYFAGGMHKAHRVAWMLARGDIPAGLNVLHHCDARYAADDRTYRRCVNPAHLWLGTHQDNVADRGAKGRTARGLRHSWSLYARQIHRRKGETSPAAKLTEADVHAIRARHTAGESCYTLAQEFGVSAANISLIVRGVAWAHLPLGGAARSARFAHVSVTDDQVRAMRARYAAGESSRQLEEDFGLHRSTVRRIITRKTWTHID